MTVSKKKLCNCGKRIDFNSTCECKDRNTYKREYFKCNKEVVAPLNTSRWRKLRSIIIKRDGSKCQRCYVLKGIINISRLQVHHIKPRIKHPELIFDETNLITLCQSCNLKLGIGELDFEPTIDVNDTDYDFKL